MRLAIVEGDGDVHEPGCCPWIDSAGSRKGGKWRDHQLTWPRDNPVGFLDLRKVEVRRERQVRGTIERSSDEGRKAAPSEVVYSYGSFVNKRKSVGREFKLTLFADCPEDDNLLRSNVSWQRQDMFPL